MAISMLGVRAGMALTHMGSGRQASTISDALEELLAGEGARAVALAVEEVVYELVNLAVGQHLANSHPQQPEAGAARLCVEAQPL